MATTPIIRVDGSVSGLGTPGVSNGALQTTEEITGTDTEATNSGATYLWELTEQPDGADVSLADATTPEFTLVENTAADYVPGTYGVKCTVNSTFTAEILFAVPQPLSGTRIPAYRESDPDRTPVISWNEGGNTRGWQPAESGLHRAVEALYEGVTRVQESTGPTNLVIGGVADGSVLKRSGSTVVGDSDPSLVHGVREIWIPAASGVLADGGTFSSVSWISGASSHDWWYGLCLPVGSRILSIDARATAAGTNQKDCQLWEWTEVGASTTSLASAVSASSGAIVLSLADINHTLVTSRHYAINFGAGDAGDVFFGLRLRYDRPAA